MTLVINKNQNIFSEKYKIFEDKQDAINYANSLGSNNMYIDKSDLTVGMLYTFSDDDCNIEIIDIKVCKKIKPESVYGC